MQWDLSQSIPHTIKYCLIVRTFKLKSIVGVGLYFN